MNNELIIEIETFIKTNKLNCFPVADSASESPLQDLVVIYSIDLSNRWLWQRDDCKDTIVYANVAKWELSMSILLKKFSERVYLVVTDDDFYPWRIFDCEVHSVLDILKNHQYFEYFIFDRFMNHILFDIHSNTLLLASPGT